MWSSAEICLVAEALRQVLAGGTVAGVRDIGPGRLEIAVQTAGGLRRWLVVLGDPLPRTHLVSAPSPRISGASAESRLLAAGLHGARIGTIASLPRERIVTADLEGAGPAGTETRRLILEFLPRGRRAVLAGRDGRILVLVGTAGRPPRTLAPGTPWSPPPPRPPDSATTTPEPPFAWLPAPFEPDLLGALESYHAATEPPLLLATAREGLLRAIDAAAAKLSRKIAEIAADLRRAEGGAELARRGEILKAHWPLLRRGLSAVEVPDPDAPDAPPLSIPLDPALDPHRNVERIFSEARRLRRGEPVARRRLERIQGALEPLVSGRAEADAAPDLAALHAVRDRLAAAGLLPAVTPARPRSPATPARPLRPAPRLPYRTFHSVEGVEIRVGRTARDNDALTRSHARGNDWWLHAADDPGSHVVVRCDGELTLETLLDAAHLAIHYSRCAPSGTRNVSYTRCKYVRKPRGAKPGLVSLSSARTLRVRMDPARLHRLLGREENPT